MKWIGLLLLACICSQVASSQNAAVQIMISISDGATGSQQLFFGLDPSATDGIDPLLGEIERPPTPPSGVFDARFVGEDIGISMGQGLLRDFRQGNAVTNGSRIHELKYQVSGGTSITISWNLPQGVTGRLQDIITGSLIDKQMTATGSYLVNQPGSYPKLKMTISYIPPSPSLSVTPLSRSVSSNAGTATFDVANVGIGMMNWTAISDQSWATIADGSSGTNSGTVTVNYTTNPSTTATRTAIITVTALGATGSPKPVSLIQGVSQNGALMVTIYNAEDWGLSGQDVRVELFDASAQMVAAQITNASSHVTFSNIPAGSGYWYKVFNQRQVVSTTWGEEYWGEKRGISVAPGSQTADTFKRNAPYAPSYHLFQASTGVPLNDGAIVLVGTPLRIDLKIKNPNSVGAVSCISMGQMKLDRDKTPPYDRSDQTTYYSLSTSDSVQAQFFFTPQIAGTYYPVFAVTTVVNGSPLITDGGRWDNQPWFTAEGSSTSSLSVTVVSAEDWGMAGQDARVELYDASSQLVGSQITNTASQVTFPSVPAGSGYWYRVFYQRVVVPTMWGEEYWGEKRNISIISGSPTVEIFKRNVSYAPSYHLYLASGASLSDGATVPVGIPLRIDLKIKNPNSAGAVSRMSMGQMKLDRDKTPPYDRSDQTTYYSLSTNDSVQAQFYFTPQIAASYYPVFAVTTMVNGSPLITDGGRWENQPFFTAENVGNALLSASPPTRLVTSSPGITSFTVSNAGTGTMNWSASSNQTWAVITAGSAGVDSGTILISYTENTSTATPRTATITVTAPGALENPKQVYLTQAAKATTEQGNLVVAVENVEGWPWTVDDGRVELYDSTGQRKTSLVTTNGIAAFLNVPSGNRYSYKVFFQYTGVQTPFGEVYWGGKTGIVILPGGTRNESFIRNMPYAPSINVYDFQSGQRIGSTVALGRAVRVDLGATNPTNPGSKRWDIRCQFILDQDKVEPFNLNAASAYFSLEPGYFTTVSFVYLPPAKGEYYYTSAVRVNVEGLEVYTAGSRWSDDPLFTVVDPTTAVAQMDASMPVSFALYPSYPNPFNPSTTIRYGLPQKSHISLTVYNTLGQQVALLQNGEQEAGYHEVEFDGNGLSSGVYFYRMQVRSLDSSPGRDAKSGGGEFVATKRLLLLR